MIWLNEQRLFENGRVRRLRAMTKKPASEPCELDGLASVGSVLGHRDRAELVHRTEQKLLQPICNFRRLCGSVRLVRSTPDDDLEGSGSPRREITRPVRV